MPEINGSIPSTTHNGVKPESGASPKSNQGVIGSSIVQLSGSHSLEEKNNQIQAGLLGNTDGAQETLEKAVTQNNKFSSDTQVTTGNIVDDSQINDSFSIFIYTFAGDSRVVTEEVSSEMTVSDLKQRLGYGGEPDVRIATIGGKPLHESKKIGDYNLGPDANLQVLGRLKGGALTEREALERLDNIITSDNPSAGYAAISADTEDGRAVIAQMNWSEMLNWANSLGAAGRAFEVEILSGMNLPTGRQAAARNPLAQAFLALQQVITYQDHGQDGGGVGAPGFTTENAERAEIVTPEEAVNHVSNVILGTQGEAVRDEFRNGDQSEAREQAAGLIRRVVYRGAGDNEVHAIGLGNDVLAGSWVNGVRSSAPYSEIAVRMDNIANQIGRERVVDIITAYMEGRDPHLTDAERGYGATLREFATIQLAERGRENSRAAEAGQDSRDYVGTALQSTIEHGFSNVYVRRANTFAPFAIQGGQAALRNLYRAA